AHEAAARSIVGLGSPAARLEAWLLHRAEMTLEHVDVLRHLLDERESRLVLLLNGERRLAEVEQQLALQGRVGHFLLELVGERLDRLRGLVRLGLQLHRLGFGALVVHDHKPLKSSGTCRDFTLCAAPTLPTAQTLPAAARPAARCAASAPSRSITASGSMRSITPWRSILVRQGSSSAPRPRNLRAAASNRSTHHCRLKYGPLRAERVAA